MDDVCIFVGDPRVRRLVQDITLISPRGRPTIKNGQKPFIEVNAQKTRLLNVSTRVALAGATFGSYVQVDDDRGVPAGRLGYELWAVTGISECAATRRCAIRRFMRPGRLPTRPPWVG